MLKTRVIGVLVIKRGIVVQSINFRRYLPVGRPSIAIDYLNRWGIDEIVMLDIDATLESRHWDSETIRDYSQYCQVPFAVGGGIADISDIDRVIRSGADKVVINSAAETTPSLIEQGAKLYGCQCMVVSIDARRKENGVYEAFTHSGTQPTGLSPVTLAKMAEERGAGEILLNSIDRDGCKCGYDLELIRQIVGAIRIPVIVCGGVGYASHFLPAIELHVSAVAAANFFHYTEHSVVLAKSLLRSVQANVRLDSHVTYDGFGFDGDGRARKVSDPALEKLRFEYIPQEVI